MFQDADCSIEVESVLFEGRTYFVKFPSNDANTIRSALSTSGIEDFVSWNRFNSVSTMRVVNRIGLIRLFSKEYDIRSEKFLESETGLRQFQIVLDDLSALSRQILFSPNAAPSANRTHSHELSQPSLLERFNYYRQTCFKKDRRSGLEELIDQIVRSPHNRLVDEHVRDHIWNSKKPSRQTIKSILSHNQSFARLPTTHPLALGRPGLRIPGTNNILFPLKALRSRGSVSTDTAENRFIKHVVLDIESVCHSVLQSDLVSGALLVQCRQLLNLSRSILRLPFFQNLGQLHSIPFSSPTLSRRHGYRDIYRIFMRSRLGAKHLFDDLAEDSLFSELKDVSLLYEYWTFYKVATTLLKPGTVYKSRSAIVKDGRIVNTAAVTDGEWTVHFNKSYSRKSKGSYSLQLRPDIVIERTSAEGKVTAMHVLDAKYKSIESTLDDEDDTLFKIIRVVKPADIHKMHCYIDAIESVQTATALYPGNTFVFYPKDRTRPACNDATALVEPSGVGAIPLMPGSANDHLNIFLAALRNSPPI